MELFLKNTASGLRPLYDDDYEEKRKLKIGQVYKAKITKARNVEFHNKYFALIKCAWEYQDERGRESLRNNIEGFRKTAEIAAGHCDIIWSLRLKEWVEVPKSIAFDKMDEIEFQGLYDRVFDVLLQTFLRHISEDEFNQGLLNFM